MQAFVSFLQLHYLDVKFVHLFFVAMWSFSTIVAYVYFVVPAFKAHQKKPDDPQRIANRNWSFFRFSAVFIGIFIPLTFYLAVAKPF